MAKITNEKDEEILAMRKILNLSQSKLAEKLGVSVRSVQSWEQGRRNCPNPIKILLKTWTKEK